MISEASEGVRGGEREEKKSEMDDAEGRDWRRRLLALQMTWRRGIG